LEDADPEDMYAVDLLTGPRDDGKDRTMSENFVRHARELVSLTGLGFVGRFGGHVARAAGCFPGLTADQVTKSAISLHQRHGQAIVSVLETAFNSMLVHWLKARSQAHAFCAWSVMRIFSSQRKRYAMPLKLRVYTRATAEILPALLRFASPSMSRNGSY
jgi:hypothetical protein